MDHMCGVIGAELNKFGGGGGSVAWLELGLRLPHTLIVDLQRCAAQ